MTTSTRPSSVTAALLTALVVAVRAVVDYRSGPEPHTLLLFWSSLLLVPGAFVYLGFGIRRQRKGARAFLFACVVVGWVSAAILLLSAEFSGFLMMADLAVLILASAACALLWSRGGRGWFALQTAEPFL